MILSLFGLSGPELCNDYISSPWALQPGQKAGLRLGMGLRLPRRACETSARKATLHLTTGAIRRLASAKLGMALGCGSGGKEQSQKSPTAQKNKKAQEGKKEAQSPRIYKKN